MLLADLLMTPPDSPAVYLRELPYGPAEREVLVRDIMALANAQCSGSRYIVIGARHGTALPADVIGVTATLADDLERDIQAVGQLLEPAVVVRVHALEDAGKLAIALEIVDCDTPPYIVAADVGAALPAGSCWVRDGADMRPALRADFDRMYGAAAAVAVAPKAKVQQRPTSVILFGFGGDPARTEYRWKVRPLNKPPSVTAANQLNHQIESARITSDTDVADSLVARLVHAQQYGSDTPYDERGISTLVENYNTVANDYAAADRYYYQEENALKLNFCVANVSKTPLQDLEITLCIPRRTEFAVAEALCPQPGSGLSEHESDLLGYPHVKVVDNDVRISQSFDLLPGGARLKLFETALRVVVQPALAGERINMEYKISSPRLQTAIQGKLMLELVA